jgi:hypothetical protein
MPNGIPEIQKSLALDMATTTDGRLSIQTAAAMSRRGQQHEESPRASQRLAAQSRKGVPRSKGQPIQF